MVASESFRWLALHLQYQSFLLTLPPCHGHVWPCWAREVLRFPHLAFLEIGRDWDRIWHDGGRYKLRADELRKKSPLARRPDNKPAFWVTAAFIQRKCSTLYDPWRETLSSSVGCYCLSSRPNRDWKEKTSERRTERQIGQKVRSVWSADNIFYLHLLHRAR